MDKYEAIEIINSLYPPDSEYDDTGRIGQHLLAQAKRNTHHTDNWRDLPDIVLEEMARLCQHRERQAERDWLKKMEIR